MTSFRTLKVVMLGISLQTLTMPLSCNTLTFFPTGTCSKRIIHVGGNMTYLIYTLTISGASYHAAARCISGGPIYITDYPDKHNKALINQMTAMTSRETTVILRPQRLAKSSQVYNAYDEPKLLKIDTYHGWAEVGTSIVGVFNVCQYALSEIISLSEFPGTEKGPYIIRSYVNGKTSIPMTHDDDQSFIHV